MQHNDDAFTAMLLTLPLTADREELVRPLTSAEFLALQKRVEASPLRNIGALIGMDISAIMEQLLMPEQEAYRICMLLSRTMPLSYAMERYYEKNIDILTLMDEEYPARLSERLDADAPIAMYVSGNLELLHKPLIGIFGISGVKMEKCVQDALRTLVRSISEEGFGILTGGEPGACRVAETEAFACGCDVVSVLAGDFMKKKEDEIYENAVRGGKMLMMSLVHPDAPYTNVHAAARNRVAYAMSLAAFIVTTDAKRGESDALRRKLCDWLYAFDTPAPLGNRIVIQRGAIPVRDIAQMDFSKYAQNWRMACAEQLTFL